MEEGDRWPEAGQSRPRRTCSRTWTNRSSRWVSCNQQGSGVCRCRPDQPRRGHAHTHVGEQEVGRPGKVGEYKTNFALVAVTENTLHAFNAKPFGRQFKVQDTVGAWQRSDLEDFLL